MLWNRPPTMAAKWITWVGLYFSNKSFVACVSLKMFFKNEPLLRCRATDDESVSVVLFFTWDRLPLNWWISTVRRAPVRFGSRRPSWWRCPRVPYRRWLKSLWSFRGRRTETETSGRPAKVPVRARESLPHTLIPVRVTTTRFGSAFCQKRGGEGGKEWTTTVARRSKTRRINRNRVGRTKWLRDARFVV